ncbi:MAG: sporulation integral membrane protein YtvI [Candidatus Epulonipiscioides saccharophilum]|nr:MAG: sporulation integral membrane protein YtvI [Epulopiscium sp. AS2M-Bin001]
MYKRILNVFIILAAIYIFVEYIFGLFAPFIIAYLIAFLLNPFVNILKNKCNIPRGLGTLVCMLTILTAFIWGLVEVVKKLINEIIDLSENFPVYKAELEQKILEISQLWNLELPAGFQSIDDILVELLNWFSDSLSQLVPLAYGTIKFVPSTLFFMIVMLIATFFITKDFYFLKDFVYAQIPDNIKPHITNMRLGLKTALGGYVKTQFILMGGTFCICFTGLMVLKRNYAFLLSVCIAIFDAFPVLGSGAFLIPWGIYHLILSNWSLGFSLLSIYGIIVVMRQILEPRVLAGQIGVYALVTIMSIYIGLQIFGAIGVFVGPMLAVSVQTLQTLGVLPKFKESSND